ncbi:MAG: transposase family protein [Succinivibrionaceae bacterium]|nr:transposase family protein [Succinivibrionaceae bacterium]
MGRNSGRGSVSYPPIECPEHGVLVADVPWAYPGSGFAKAFDLTVGWLAVYLPRSTVSEYMRIDWETVGRCVHRTLDVIEPERARRLDNLSTLVLTRLVTGRGRNTLRSLSTMIQIR